MALISFIKITTTTTPLLSIQLQTIPKSPKLFKVSAFSSPLPDLSPSTTRRRVLSLSVVSISLSSFSPASSTEFLELPDSGGVKALDLRGGTGSVPIDGDQVAIHYYGRLAAKQGWRFDSTYDHKDATGEPVPFVFILGSGKVRSLHSISGIVWEDELTVELQVIAGIEAAVRSMKVGGIRRVVIPPSQGYQNTTQEPLPPNFFDRQRLFTTIFNPTRLANGEGSTLGTLIFDIELISLKHQ